MRIRTQKRSLAHENENKKNERQKLRRNRGRREGRRGRKIIRRNGRRNARGMRTHSWGTQCGILSLIWDAIFAVARLSGITHTQRVHKHNRITCVRVLSSPRRGFRQPQSHSTRTNTPRHPHAHIHTHETICYYELSIPTSLI